MATIILRPSTTYRYGSSATLTDVSNIRDGDSSTYATFSTTSYTSEADVFLSKFDFSSIPDGVQITSIKAVVEISATRVNTSLLPKFGYKIINGAVSLNVGTFSPTITNASSSDHISSATMTLEDFTTLTSYGEGGGIIIPIKRSSPFGGSAEEKIYEVYIEVTYSSTPSSTNNTRVGSSTPNKYYVGSSEVNKIYQGSDLIYES